MVTLNIVNKKVTKLMPVFKKVNEPKQEIAETDLADDTTKISVNHDEGQDFFKKLYVEALPIKGFVPVKVAW